MAIIIDDLLKITLHIILYRKLKLSFLNNKLIVKNIINKRDSIIYDIPDRLKKSFERLMRLLFFLRK